MGKFACRLIALSLLAWSSPALADPGPICPDRPGRGTGTCTVPKGMIQVETGLADWTHDEADGFSADATVIGSTLIKYGLSDRADIELGVTPLILLRATGAGTESGFGDTMVRFKYALTGNDAPVTVALDPFVKLPTANRIFGNGKVEAGLTIPVSAALGKSPLTLSLSPEVDWLADGDGSGHHAAMVQVVGIGLAATSRLTLVAELWGQWDWDPAGTVRQASADASAAYLVSDNVAIDGGANFGLNAVTPDAEVYTGVSVRF